MRDHSAQAQWRSSTRANFRRRRLTRRMGHRIEERRSGAVLRRGAAAPTAWLEFSAAPAASMAASSQSSSSQSSCRSGSAPRARAPTTVSAARALAVSADPCGALDGPEASRLSRPARLEALRRRASRGGRAGVAAARRLQGARSPDGARPDLGSEVVRTTPVSETTSRLADAMRGAVSDRGGVAREVAGELRERHKRDNIACLWARRSPSPEAREKLAVLQERLHARTMATTSRDVFSFDSISGGGPVDKRFMRKRGPLSTYLEESGGAVNIIRSKA